MGEDEIPFKGASKRQRYEYRVEATPRYTSEIEGGWELVDVFIKWLPNGSVNYVLVFRRQLSNVPVSEKCVYPDLGPVKICLTHNKKREEH